MDEKSLKPQLRFKEFTDAWEQRKLSEIASYLPSNHLQAIQISMDDLIYMMQMEL